MRDPPDELAPDATRLQRGWWTVRLAWWHLHHSWDLKLTFTPWWGTIALVAASALGAVRCWSVLPSGTHWAVFGALVVGAAPAIVREVISLDGDSGNWGPAAWGLATAVFVANVTTSLPTILVAGATQYAAGWLWDGLVFDARASLSGLLAHRAFRARWAQGLGGAVVFRLETKDPDARVLVQTPTEQHEALLSLDQLKRKRVGEWYGADESTVVEEPAPEGYRGSSVRRRLRLSGEIHNFGATPIVTGWFHSTLCHVGFMALYAGTLLVVDLGAAWVGR